MTEHPLLTPTLRLTSGLSTLLCLVFILIFPRVVVASEAIWVFEDTTASKTYDEVRDNPQWFKSVTDTTRGFTDSVFWIKVKLSNPTQRIVEQTVQFDSIFLPEVQEFRLSGQSTRLRSNGYLSALAVRASPDVEVRFPQLLPPNTDVSMLYRIETPYKADLGYRVLNSRDSQRIPDQLILQVLVIGGIIILLAYNLFIAIIIRSRVYYAYSLFLAMNLVAAATLFRFHEHIGLVLDVGWLEARVGVALYAAALWFLNLLFADQQTKTTRALSRFYYVLVFAHLLLDPVDALRLYAQLTGFVVSIILTFIIWNALRLGNRLARFILAGWVIYIGFALLFIGNMVGLLGTEYEVFFAYGNLIEGVVCSAVLAYRLREMDKTEELLKAVELELEREQLASEIGYGFKCEIDQDRNLIKPDATYALWHGNGWQAGNWYPLKQILDSTPEEYRDRLVEQLNGIRNALTDDPKYVFSITYPMLRSDNGKVITINIVGKRVQFGGSNLVVATALDVSEIDEQRKNVQAEIEKLQGLSEQAKLFFWRLNIKTKRVDYSRSFAKHWELPEGAQIAFADFARFMSPSFFKLVSEATNRVVETEQPVEEVSRGRAGKTEGQWHRLQLWPVFDEWHKVSAVDFAVTNINELMESQTQLQATIDNQKELFAIVGHELRTPVSTIKMLTEDTGQAERTRIEQISDISDGLLHVLEDMRIVISPERALESKPILENPSFVIERSLRSLQTLVSERGLVLSANNIQVSNDLYWLNAQALRQIVTNLVKNAAIHSRGSRIEVSFTLTKSATGGANACLRVEDDGSGIDPLALKNIFQAFKRGNTIQDGSGLGLYIVKQLAERLNGEVHYSESQLGGAAFILEFPLGESVKQSSSEPAKKSGPTLAGMRILLVEDDKTLRMLTERMLTNKGAVITSCVNGREAFEIFDPSAFDLVVTDLMMPEMDGLELTRAIRASGATTKIIAVTAAVIGAETEQLVAEGANKVLAKPLRPIALEEALA